MPDRRSPDWPARLELGIAERALPGEQRSGDRAVLVAYEGGALVAAIDGLGHGGDAADAAEIARNITTYAGEGEVALRVLNDGGRNGIEVVASDDGPGIENVELAMQDGYTTGNGLGLGLPGTRRLVDEFDIDTAPGVGTKVRLVKWTRA